MGAAKTTHVPLPAGQWTVVATGKENVTVEKFRNFDVRLAADTAAPGSAPSDDEPYHRLTERPFAFGSLDATNNVYAYAIGKANLAIVTRG